MSAPTIRRFPIQGGPSIPWDAIAPHERQAQHNHDQSLQRLAERGGLSPCEAVAVLEDRAWRSMDQEQAKQRMLALVAPFEESALKLAKIESELSEWRSWVAFVWMNGGAAPADMDDSALRAFVCKSSDERLAQAETAQPAADEQLLKDIGGIIDTCVYNGVARHRDQDLRPVFAQFCAEVSGVMDRVRAALQRETR